MRAKNRYLVLGAGMIIQFCAGIIYMWSVFRGPVSAHLNWDAGAAALTSSVMLAMFVLGIIAGGYAQDKLGPKRVTIAGSSLIGAGMACTALVTAGSPWLVYVTYGVVGGLGVGTVYTATVAAIQKWFPDRRGFASGMIVSAFGFSLVVFAPLARAMLASLGVTATFLIFGASFFVLCGACSLAIQNPPEGYSPGGYKPAQAAASRRQYAPKEIVKTKQYYLLAGGLLFTLPAYFILNPVFLSLGAVRGLSEDLALLGVALTGVSSAAGRLAVSWISDKTGRKVAMVAIALIILCASLTMIVGEGLLFLLCIMLISFGFGGASSVYAAMTAESFGTRYGGMNFGLVMLGFGVSALVFPMISNRITAGGSYTGAFLLASATCAVAVALVLMMDNPAKSVSK
ncbi:MAG: MFS transporter [Oscillospiraceae bacterium]|jgi:OFA family oxalate/formate antiporter-like MFS transporter|nr:MFS transporter [Oscillospiraceae bacterium]